MNAESLMIGNLVTIESDFYSQLKGIVYKITGIQEKQNPVNPDDKYAISLELCDPNGELARHYPAHYYISCWSCALKPIPITAEWLDMFGFVYSMQYGFHKVPELGDKSRLMITNGTIGLNARPLGVGGINDDFKFIHELQNHLQVNHKIKLEIK